MSLSTEYRTVRLLGVELFAVRMEQVLKIAGDHIASRRNLLIGVVNAAKIVNARKEHDLRAALDGADILLADGAPIVWLSRVVGKPLPERIAGIDLMFGLLKDANARHYGIYFLGAKTDVVTEVVRIVERDYPGIRIAGWRDGYFRADEEQGVAVDIRSSRADILFVAISPPRKEMFLGKWYEFMNIPVCHGVGGSFDVLAGVTKRAPAWMRKWGLEWLFRLIQEPRRMWKRYLVTNTVFIGLCAGEIAKTFFAVFFQKSPRSNSTEPRKGLNR